VGTFAAHTVIQEVKEVRGRNGEQQGQQRDNHIKRPTTRDSDYSVTTV
jgi:hypothetical protein